jgi:CheY-like chemotaxis protein
MSAQTILIVEDDKWLAEQFSRVLTNAGYRAKITTHALAAIYEIDDILPSAIILDVLLVGSTAFTLLHELQSYSDTGSIPIILCTNLASELSTEDLSAYGVKQILDKTKMKPNDLLAVLQSVL